MTTDSIQYDLADTIHTALMCDVLDAMGHLNACIGRDVYPLAPSAPLVRGRAFTMTAVPTDRAESPPFGTLLKSYRELNVGDVIVIAADGYEGAGIWGGLLATAARARGVVGVVIDGQTRDIRQLDDMAFPTFARGVSPVDSLGRLEVVDFGTTVQCGEVTIKPGDFIVGDEMGVLSVPSDMVGEAIARAKVKDSAESSVAEILASGADVAEVFEEYGVL